jgi:hypothetical protein
MEPETTSPLLLTVVNMLGGWEVIYGILATLVSVYLGKKNINLKKVIREADEFTDILDIATRPDSEEGAKISLNESKRIAYAGKDVVLAIKEILHRKV